MPSTPAWLAAHTDRVRQKRQSMAEMLKEISAVPPEPANEPDPWLLDVDTGTGTGLPGPHGVLFDRVDADISAGRAVALLQAGALVAWDGCGCSSSSCLIWLDQDQRQVLMRSGRPDVRRQKSRFPGSLSQWRSVEGQELILAECHVRWGHELA